MVSTGILNTDNPIHVFTLHLIFIPKSTKHLTSFVKPLITTKYVQRETGHHTKCGQMFHANNPLSHGLLDEEPSVMEIYGYDPQGPSPTGRDNHVVIDPVDLCHGDLLKSFVLEHLDPQNTQSQSHEGEKGVFNNI